MKQILLVSFLLFSSFIHATLIEVTSTDDLQQALDSTINGDTVLLDAGSYQGNFVIKNAITLTTKEGAVIDALGKGHALQIMASDTSIKNLTIINWGSDLTEQDSGIYSESRNQNITIENNRLEGDGFGIWVQRAKHILIKNNHIKGNLTLRSADRGNGIQLSSVQNALVINNSVTQTRDGLYIIASQESELRGNTLYNLRYGVHYMYSHHNKVLNNRAYNTRAGYALMSSKYLTVKGNESRDSEDYGMLMNFITHSTISNNRIKNVWTKPENKVPGREGKGLFIYNSGYNTISYNRIEQAEIGIHLTAGSENGNIFGNSFINNPVQVKYVSNRRQEWSQEGIGNYWSNYLGWDLDGNGTGDTPFEPNDAIDKLVWQYPEAKVLLDSPAILLLRWVQNQFPLLKPGGVKDSFPLIKQPDLEGDQT
ncbi:nitrous oxide reductase family maturation protein NosD [Psychromonas sp. Urea-02u-13]|uniref:nitrous oxide reductase family maturation protein NosD n=1 Tax=Psychromonas sp. Urea-02u-13 TaxID=2058326 RepID=UPI001E44E20A|nr:nitrous oxide reductase family maturation protein NosD [Psychromonas sp. Urea-02u-13]